MSALAECLARCEASDGNSRNCFYLLRRVSST